MMRAVLLLFILMGMAGQSFALPPDTTTVKKEKWVPDSTHTPRKAALFSLVLPGAGQIYNRRYWKAPIVWAALATTTYFIVDNQRNYTKWRSAYLDRLEDPSIHIDTEFELYSEGSLRTIADVYRRQRDLSYVATAVVYTLQVIEANVDAHFLHFDVSDNLSMEVRPTLLPNTAFTGFQQPGMRLTLSF